MHHYKQGQATKQAHKGIPEGFFEEEQGHLGFFGPVSHLIRKKPSTRWVEIDGPLKPRMFDLAETKSHQSWQSLLFNTDVELFWYTPAVKTIEEGLGFRNADGDTLYFCHKGEGHIYSDYGHLCYKRGDYIVIPKCITHSILPLIASEFFIVENKTSHFKEPDRGIVGRHAVYDINAIQKPNLDKQISDLEKKQESLLEIQVKHSGVETRFKYQECIYDTIGWKGDLFPYTLNVDDMMPLMSHRAHLPPSAHTTFVASGFVVCTFLPRPLESDGDALKVPFYHQNIDYDEVLFYHDGDFFSRDNLHSGMMSFHPAGFPHGPHPKAVHSVQAKTHTTEYAVMVDTRKPLNRSDFMGQIELENYWASWKA